ncbi:DUF1287 domain-containing protein [Phragmitibacter flavus]|uniref:DUF1287 domain-containing protein n=1 Tax=Phragmitibacter flavus TaxID=2576071 RepID=A0A5R8KA92_9BACT|nr:DUF1287 domain-containing protein [Phragmitibacter flavus]TLD69243.1 DUF1287 domain-containing protein [Phragmitibacter flavus]
MHPILSITLHLFLTLTTPLLADQSPAQKLINSARKQIGVTTHYDPAYVSLTYPNGDLPKERGVCTDVVIRAMRDALNLDLQKLVHEDMRANFAKSPKIWGLKRPDKNIDHRRVPNLQVYLTRHHQKLKATTDPANYQPGDLVTCLVGGNLPHIMIVSDKKSATGTYLIIHNIGTGTQEEDRLFQFPLTGHYRLR